MNKCPFGFKKHEECALYRRGVRIITNPGTLKEEQVPFEECAFNIIADCLENLIGRQIGVQKELNMIRNSSNITNALFGEILKVGKQNASKNMEIPSLDEGQ